MNIKLFFAMLIVSCILSCNKNRSTTSDPTEELAWLKTQKTEMAKNCACEPAIWEATFESKTIYETGCKGPACLCAHIFYNEDGSVVKGSEESNRVVFLEQVKNRQLIWTCK